MKLIIESWHCVMEQYQFPGVDYMRSRWSKPKVKIQARYVGLSFEEVGLLLNSFDNSSVFDTGVHKDTLVRFRRYADGYPVVDTYTDRQGKSRYNVLIPLCIYDITPDEDINIDDDTVSGLAEKMQEEVDRQECPLCSRSA